MSSVTEEAAPAPQLTFQLVNAAGGVITPDVIFITDDVSYNELSLEIGLTSGSAALSPGTIPDPSDPPPASGTVLYIDLSALQLSSTTWDGLTFDGDGWQFQKFVSQGVVGMTPIRTLTLTSGTSGQISIAIAGVVVAGPLSSPQVQLYVTYDNVPGVIGEYSTFAVAVQNRPDDQSKDLAEAIGVSLSANGIVNSILPLLEARNGFALDFASTQKVLVDAGSDTVFTVSFVYGAPNDRYGFGALTDVTNGMLIDLTAGTNAAQWKITQNPSNQSPSWALQPPPDASIVGTGVQSIVEFRLSNVLTTYQPGPTAMLVSYANVPGYKDGTYALVLQKIAHVQINAFSVAPNPTFFAGGTAEVTLRWDVAAAQGLMLAQNGAQTPVTGKTEWPATLTTGLTTFGLTATGAAGTAENLDVQTVTAIALPVINSFSGSPTEIYAGSVSHDALFAWAVDSGDGVTLSSTGNAFSGQSYQATDQATATIVEPQMISLAATTAGNPLTLTRRLVISAFRPWSESYPRGITPVSVAVAPAGPFVLFTGQGDSLTAFDTLEYSAISSVALGHTATTVRFSADGATVATTNTDRTVSILSVGLDDDGLPMFGVPATISVSAAPQRLIFSPNGPRIFVTIDPGDGVPGQLVSLLASAGSYQLEGSVTVGIAPRGLTLDATGLRVFVANSGSDTVSIIGLTAAGGLGAVTVIDKLTGGPTGIAATPSGLQLLVSCATAGTVIVLDPDHPDTGQRQTLTVGGSPGTVAIMPSGGYAFVANRNNTVSLINCWGLPAAASLLPSLYGAGSPTDLSISPDGLQVLVAQSIQANVFTVVTLSTYTATATRPSTLPYPTSVALTPDGGCVFAWHDATAASPASPGIRAFTVASGESTDLLASLQVTRFVVSPDPQARQAFAIAASDGSLYVVATDTMISTSQSLGLPSGTYPVALAMSGDGVALFVATADADRNLTLVVLEQTSGTWTAVQSLPLYQATTTGRILLRATLDGTSVFLVDVSAAQVRTLRKASTGYALSSTVIAGQVSALDLTILPDGATAYLLNAGSSTNTITVIDIATLTCRVAAIPRNYVRLTALETSPDGRRLFAPDSSATALRVLDPSSLRVLQVVVLGSGVKELSGLAVAPDGSAIYTANTGSQNLSIVEQIQMGTLADSPAPSRRWSEEG